MNQPKLYCTDCPDRESCDAGYPCDFVRSINDILESENFMSNIKHTVSSVAADAIKAANEKAERVQHEAAEDETAEAIDEATELLGKASKKLKSVSHDADDSDDKSDDAKATHFVVRIPKFSTIVKNKKHVFIGLGGVAVIAAAAFLKFNQKQVEIRLEDVSDEGSDSEV